MSDPTEPAALLALAEARAPALLELLAELVAIPSGSTAPAGPRAVLDRLAPSFESLGFAATWQEGQHPELTAPSHHLLLERPRPGALPVLHLGHADTVFDEVGSARPLERGPARWSGPGVADMKGGLVVLLGTQQLLAEVGGLDALDTRIVLNSDEEIQSASSRALIEEAARGRALGLVYEPGRPGGTLLGGAVLARKGVGAYRVEVQGVAAHAGNAYEQGRNAIVGAAHRIQALAARTERSRDLTVNVGLISGGTSRNTVAARCTFEVDLRFWEAADGAGADAAIRTLTEVIDPAGCTATVQGGIGRPPWRRRAEDERLHAVFTGAASSLGLGLDLFEVGGGSDANFLAARGLPVLDGLGAVGTGYHRPDEAIDPRSLGPRMALTALALLRLSRSSDFPS